MQKVNKIGNWQTKAYHRELGLPGTELFYSSFIIYVKRSNCLRRNPSGNREQDKEGA